MGALACVDHLYTCTKDPLMFHQPRFDRKTGIPMELKCKGHTHTHTTICPQSSLLHWYNIIVSEELFVRWTPAGVYRLVVAMCSVPLTIHQGLPAGYTGW